MDERRLLIGYFAGMDLRRIDRERTPYLARRLASRPWAKLATYPSTELTATLFTGTYPERHGSFHVKLKPRSRAPEPAALLDRLPDGLATTIQGFAQVLRPSPDNLATIPHRRLRHFEPRRYKYGSRGRRTEDLVAIGGVPTIFGILGLGTAARYVFARRLGQSERLMSETATPGPALDFIESRALDLFQHWNLHEPARVGRAYREIDDLIGALHERCRRDGVTMAVVSDHGQEVVRGSMDLLAGLGKLGVPGDEYEFFLEPSMARFWFHGDDARRRVSGWLRSLERVSVLTLDEMRELHLRFDDDGYGELFVSPDPGYVFFPNDFYRPLASLFLGLVNPTTRSRLRDPRLKGDHGYLPRHDSEKGFMVVLDEGYAARTDLADVVDVAPSILELMGRPVPETMQGRPLFRRAPVND